MNSVCENAELSITVNGMVTVGSNENGSYASSSIGGYNGCRAWYKLIGTRRNFTVSTCTPNTTDFATVVSVLSSTDGTCGDDKLDCMGTASGSDSAFFSGCATPGTGSMITNNSVAGTTYYASVIGVADAVGDFGVTIFYNSAGCEDDKVAQPVDGTVTVGSNVNGSYVLSCNTKYHGCCTWYKFIGTGRNVTVLTCNPNTTDFATVVSVLSSTDGTCGDDKLECIHTASGSDSAFFSGCATPLTRSATPLTGSVVTINSVAGTSYYASVIGFEGLVGDFGLMICDDSAGCGDDIVAQPVDGTVTVGSNVNGHYVLSCDTQYHGHGTWYKFIGTGRSVTVSTCTPNTTDFATVVSVLSSFDGTLRV